MRRAAAAWLCVIVVLGLAGFTAVGAGARAVTAAAEHGTTPTSTASTTTTVDTTATTNDFKAWVPIGLGVALIGGIAISKRRRR